jgi:glycerol uptake facilitator-like aquaporin
MLKNIFAEVFGTFILVFTLNLSASPWATGGAVWIAMIITHFKSGAFFSPAILTSVATKKLLEKNLSLEELKEYIIFVIFQMGTGIVAAYAAWKLGHKSIFFDFQNEYSPYKAFLCEMIFTTIFCLNCLRIGKRTNALYTESVVSILTVITGALTIGHLTKNCLNPAVGLGINLVFYINNGNHLSNVWVYIISPIFGSIIAAFISAWYTNIQKKKDHRKTSLYLRISMQELQITK